jgi:HEPN domain-containing protein
MADSPEVGDWVDRAEQDVKTVRLLVADHKLGLGPVICFHCQQAAEKYLKACLIRARVRFPKTHDFEELLTLCGPISPEFQGLAPATGRLQPFVVLGRYPTTAPSEAVIDQAIYDMDAVRRFCRCVLGSEPA